MKKEKSDIWIELGQGIVIYIFITVLFFCYLFWEHTPIFGINDDWTIYMVLSGSYLGEPDPYVLFILYPLAWILCKLYGMTTSIPWYGLLLQGCFAFSGFLIFIRLFMRSKKLPVKKIQSIAVLILFYFFCLPILVAIQYTHSAAICGATAIFWFFTSDIENKNWKEALLLNIPTIFMACLSLCIRKNVALMCIPVAGMLFLAKWYMDNEEFKKNNIRKYMGICSVTILAMVSLLICHNIAYSSEEWSEYSKINYYREKVVDFYGEVSYDEMKDMADSIGMSKEDYEIRQSILPYYKATIPYSEFLKSIMEYSRERYEKNNPFHQKIKTSFTQIWDSMNNDFMKPQNTLVIVLFIALGVFVIRDYDKKVLVGILGFLFGRFFSWFYILFNGRFPIRIPQSLYLIDFCVIVGFFYYLRYKGLKKKEQKNNHNNVSVLVINILLLIVITLGGYEGVKNIKIQNSYVEIFQDRWYGIKEYCMKHPENMYLLNGGSQTLYYFSDDIFDTNTIGASQNYYANSNFYSISPNCYKKIGLEIGDDVAEEILMQDKNYWIYEQGCFSEDSSIVNYYKNRYSSFSFELVDRFQTQTSSYEVYHFRK